MRAVHVRAFAPFETVSVEEVPDPQPGPGEVVIDVIAADVNYPDILVITGQYQIKPPLPFSPGKAAAGVVSAVGEGVRDLKVGDRVAAQVEYGAYAEKLVARAESCFKMPAGMPFHVAAALGLVYQTAWFALQDRAAFKPGEVVLVLGAAGGIGMASVELAKALGAKTVIAGVRGEGKAEVARKAGADHVVDLAAPNLRDALRVQVNALSGGHGADVVIDPVGGEANAAALRALAWCGRLVIVGFASGDIPSIRSNYLLVKNIAVSGIQWSDYRDRTPERVCDAQRAIFALYEQGKLNPTVSARLPLEQFAEALSALRDGKASGKIVLQVRPE